MKTYIICDSNNDFLSDVETTMMLESYPFQVATARSPSEAQNQYRQFPGATIIFNDNVLNDSAFENLASLPIYGYCNNPAGESAITGAGLPFIGLYRTSEMLLNALLKDPQKIASSQKTSVNKPQAKPAQPAPAPAREPAKQVAPTTDTPAPKPAQSANKSVPAQPKQQTVQGPTAPVQPAAQTPPQQTVPQPQPVSINGVQMTPEMMAALMQIMAMGNQVPQPQPAAAQPVQNPVPERVPATQPEPEPEYTEEPDDTAAESVPEDAGGPQAGQVEADEDLSRQKPETAGSKIRGRKKDKEEKAIDSSIDEDLMAKSVLEKNKTRVISIYAAKGGVGKTSVATELAVYLALTTNGRRRFRVCIVDYNIDFGDVATTLQLADDGPNMTYWASEISEMIARGEDPDTIQFTRQEIEDRYLQKMKDTGLYALCAPIVHQDSMTIHQEELQTMLRNLIDNGGFDYIICDTGNNTRDSSFIALESSDFILLVATQDITTANCNASVLRTLQDAGFDTEKVRLVINNVMPARETGISVQEVEETFPYRCICRIKRTPDIIRANNLSRPLVYKPNHEYTKQIQRIVRFVTAGEIVEEKENRGFFGFFKR